MTYQELYDEVVALTNRPDLAAETASAVKSATLRCHNSDFYERDVIEKRITFAQSAFLQQFDVRGVFTRYRKIKYLRYFDPTGRDAQTGQATGAAGAFFDVKDPEQALDSYNTNVLDMCYVAGNTMNIRGRTSFQNCLCGWYASPIIVPAQYSSWIAEAAPFAIIFDAASLVFNMIGFQEQSRKFDSLISEQIQMVKMVGLGGKGY